MEALAATKFGPPGNVLQFVQTDIPEPGPTEVRIRVHYAELNPVDLHKLSGDKEGKPIPSHRCPFIVGYGGSGVIDKAGKPADDDDNEKEEGPLFEIGDNVAFLCDPRRNGCYAEYVVVDRRLVSAIPNGVSFAEAAAVPLSGCTAYEALEKVGLTIGDLIGGSSLEMTDSSPPKKRQRKGGVLLIVGGAGGVGSWCSLLARAAYPDLEIVSTASTTESEDWCLKMGANRTIAHSAVKSLGGGPKGSVDHIICLTEPTQELFASLTEILRPFGSICLVVAGDSIKSLDMSFVFFKSGTVCTETVFSSSRAGFHIDQARQIRLILEMIAMKPSGDSASDRTPLVLGDIPGKTNWKSALKSNGVMEVLASGHSRGKLVMNIGSER